MTPLTQQLEDKKKGCGRATDKIKQRYEYVDSLYNCGENPHPKYKYCEQCKEIIAILEQAIAEIKNIQSQQDENSTIPNSTYVEEAEFKTNPYKIVKDNDKQRVEVETGSADISNLLQKQRQEILEDIEEILNEFVNDSDIDGRKICFEFHDTDLFELRDKLSKLNQPKTKHEGLHKRTQKHTFSKTFINKPPFK